MLRRTLAALFFLTCAACNFGGAGDESSDRGAVQGAGTKIDPGFNLLSPQQDVEIGRQSAVEVERQLPLLDEGAAADYVAALGARLAQNAPGEGFEYRFKVIDASDLNAFALPGGYIYLNRGVLESARSEGEVAGVLAHEIAHVAYRHGTHNVSKAYLTQAGIGLLGGLLGGGETSAGTMIQLLGGFGLNALFLKYSRTAETQADVGGAQILARSGYDPQEMVRFFETLQRVDKQKVITFFSDHPSPEKRVERIQREAKLLAVAAPRAIDHGELKSVQRQLGSLPPARQLAQMAGVRGPAPEAPTRPPRRTVAVAAPAATYTTFASQDGGFSVDHPSNWVAWDDERGGATIAPKGGAGELNGSVEIVYGAIVNRYEPISDEATERRMENGAISIDDALTDLTGAVRSGSPYLQPSNSPSGSRGNRRITLEGTSPRTGISERVVIGIREMENGSAAFVIFVTPRKEAAAYAPVFEKMFGSLRANRGTL
jgi:hypothetical protein